MMEALFSAIQTRHSTRTFLSEPLPEELVQQVWRFSQGLALPFSSDVTFRLFRAAPGKGLYNNGIAPCDNLAAIAETDLVSISKAGFAGELLVLYATSLGLSTCWFGHYKLSELGKYLEHIATKERLRESTLGYGYGNQVDVGARVICCIPFGRGDENSKRIIDHIMKKLRANRKPLRELMEPQTSLEALPGGGVRALEAARLAPSAGNSQMWRFGYESTSRTLTVAKPIGYRHFKWEHPDVDIGICAAHVWLGLLHEGCNPAVSVVQSEDRALWRFEL